MNVERRPVRADDQEFLLSLYASYRESEMSLVPWSEDEKAKFVASQFQAQQQHYRDAFPTARHELLLDGARPIGQSFVHRDENEIRLVDVIIAKTERGRGIGTSLMRELQAEASAKGLPIRLSLWVGNEAALRLYARLGFVEEASATEKPSVEENIYRSLEWRANR